ncbi:MAG TPA: hypothetical protein PK863_02045 [Candidatus Dojkabacteria bacterium]|nr:hypothetical protein [Candidatus Dojkabacteria bacterium]HRP50758.1 hypothetical protein [Candidatus Dojkabacteria bacterium]
MSYLGNSYLKEFIIGGGLQTAEHKKSGGYRLDMVHTPGLNRAWYDYEKILEAPNGDGTNYAVFKLTGTDYYLFAVHIRNARSAKRGEIAFDLVPSKFLHVHIKIGGYASTVTKYLRYLEHLDPSIKISTSYGSNAYTGLNKGVHLPISNSNQPPMSFNYDLYLKGSDMYMRVTSGSINENATVKNISKGTSWTVFCNKSVGNDGGPINTGMLEALYEVTAKGVTKQYDNRPDPCKAVKTELETMTKVVATKDSEIAKLNARIGGLTTDRNKYKAQVEELQPTIDSLNAQLDTAHVELLGKKKELEEAKHQILVLENEALNWEPQIVELKNTVAEQNSQLITKTAQYNKLEEKYEKLLQETQGSADDYKRLLKDVYTFIKNLFNRKHEKN